MKDKFKKILFSLKQMFFDNIFLIMFVIANTLCGYLLKALTINQYFNFVSFMGELSFSFLLGLLSLLFKKKRRKCFLIIMLILGNLLCFSDLIYYGYYNSFLSVEFISLLFANTETGGTAGSVLLDLINIKYIIIFIPFIIFLVVNAVFKKNKVETSSLDSKLNRKRVFFTWLFLFIIFIVCLSPIDYSRIYKQWNREYLVGKFGIYIYHASDALTSIRPTISELFGSDQAYSNFKNFYYSKSEHQSNEYSGIFEGMNVITIHYESAQQFAMELEFNGKEVTPVLNKMASEGMYFSNFYSQISVGTSSDAEYTFMTSILPVKSGSVFVNYADKKFESIPILLKEKGYYTFSMHANSGKFWNRDQAHISLGYDKLYDKSYYVLDEKIGFGLSDKSFYTQSVPMIKEISEENSLFYANMITLSNHTPFDEVKMYGNFDVTLTANGKTYQYMEDTKMGNYLKSLHYADKQLGLFMKLLDEAGLLENTVVVIYGDHDAKLSKSDYNRLINYDVTTNLTYNDSDPRYQELDYYWFELNRNVPLVIWTKNNQIKEEITTAMGMYDVLPTLGNMLNIKSKYALGTDIFNVDDNIVVFPNGNWLTNNIYYNSGKGEYKLLKDTVLTEDEIEKNTKYAEDILKISDDTVVFDLIKKDQANEYMKEG